MAHLDFDGEPLKLVEDAYTTAQNQQQVRNNQYQRDWQNFMGWIDMKRRNPDQANVFVPKPFIIVETKVPRNVRSVVGMRPYIPFESTREEYRYQSQLMQTMLDELLYRGGMYSKYNDGAKVKTLYGTSFIEALPYYDQIIQKAVVADEYGQPTITENATFRLRLRLRVYAPWEIYVDPYALNLEDKDACRFVVKIELVSRRQLIVLAQKGAYPDLDIELLSSVHAADSQDKAKHWGFSMLADMGIPMPEGDDDMGVLMRYESSEAGGNRYIDIWNGQVVLRDIENPYKHGKINLSRHKHTSDAHPQNSFWGIGEMKPNEILFAMNNDTWNMTLNSHQLHNQPTTYYRKDAVHPDALVRTAGNRVAIDAASDRPISDSIEDAPMHPLPRDHYMIPHELERMIDMTSGIYDMQRGESPIKQSTASEAAMRREAGDIRLELEIRNSEAFLADLGDKCLSHIDQFATIEDKIEILGQQAAMQLEYGNPDDIPGGYNYRFKGSARAANQLTKQRNIKELSQILLNVPNVLPGEFSKLILQIHDFTESEINRIVIPDQVMMQMQQQQQQQEDQREFEENERQRAHERDIAEIKRKQAQQKSEQSTSKRKTVTGRQGGKYKENTAVQTAEGQAREGIRT